MRPGGGEESHRDRDIQTLTLELVRQKVQLWLHSGLTRRTFHKYPPFNPEQKFRPKTGEAGRDGLPKKTTLI